MTDEIKEAEKRCKCELCGETEQLGLGSPIKICLSCFIKTKPMRDLAEQQGRKEEWETKKKILMSNSVLKLLFYDKWTYYDGYCNKLMEQAIIEVEKQEVLKVE